MTTKFPLLLSFQVESVYLQSPLSMARFTGRNFGRIAVDWDSRAVRLIALDELGTPQLTKILNLDEMGPTKGGECDGIGRGSLGLRLVTSIRVFFPHLSNTQSIVAVIILFCMLAPLVFMMALIYAAFVSCSAKKSCDIHSKG
jgi:hypothetical protein